jgi:hypothetical protein
MMRNTKAETLDKLKQQEILTSESNQMKIYMKTKRIEMSKKTVWSEMRKKTKWVMVYSTTEQLNQLVLCQLYSFNLINRMRMRKSIMIRKVVMESLCLNLLLLI